MLVKPLSAKLVLFVAVIKLDEGYVAVVVGVWGALVGVQKLCLKHYGAERGKGNGGWSRLGVLMFFHCLPAY